MRNRIRLDLVSRDSLLGKGSRGLVNGSSEAPSFLFRVPFFSTQAPEQIGFRHYLTISITDSQHTLRVVGFSRAERRAMNENQLLPGYCQRCESQSN